MTSAPVSFKPWFKRWGWLHLPVALAGVIASLLALAFCAHVFIALDRHSHSASDTLSACYPYFVGTFLMWTWLAERTSGK